MAKFDKIQDTIKGSQFLLFKIISMLLYNINIHFYCATMLTWTNWGFVAQKKEFGGLGIPNIADMNLCLLASWIKRYHPDDDKLWKKIVDHKYMVNNPNIFSSSSIGVSPFWKGVLWAAKIAKWGYWWKVGNGKKVKFWEDQWFGSSSLAIQFWEIYVLVNEKTATIAELWDGNQLKVPKMFWSCFDDQMVWGSSDCSNSATSCWGWCSNLEIWI